MKTFLLNVLFVATLFAGTYDDSYVPTKNMKFAEKDPFMYGDFSEIIRFDMLSYIDGELEESSDETLKNIIEKVQTYMKGSDEIKVKVIGHGMEASDDMNEVTIDASWFTHKEYITTEETTKNSSSYANHVAAILKNHNISESITVVEHRGAQDLGFSSGTDYGRELSNRVMVTLYVLGKANGDEDQDSVPEPNDTDEDGVFDYKDECPETPLGAEVNEVGCQMDEDGDGVLDAEDQCPGTPEGMQVDTVGCPISMTLRLNFDTDSYAISSYGEEKVQRFAEFMQGNQAYTAVIEGHTDSRATEAYNDILSLNRANSVKRALVRYGVEAKRLDTLGKGELSPMSTNSTSEGRAENRRIEVKLSN